MLTKAFEMSDEEAQRMNPLFQLIRKSYLEWKGTKRLPNGDFWDPYQPSDGPVNHRNRFLVSDFTSVLGSRFNIDKNTAKKLLLTLKKQGKIELKWTSPNGSYFILKRRKERGKSKKQECKNININTY